MKYAQPHQLKSYVQPLQLASYVQPQRLQILPSLYFAYVTEISHIFSKDALFDSQACSKLLCLWLNCRNFMENVLYIIKRFDPSHGQVYIILILDELQNL